MNPEAIPAAVIFGLAFLAGARSTRRLLSTYGRIAPLLAPNRRAIGRAFVVVSVMVLGAVGWLGFLAVRRLLGFEPIEWSFVVSYLVSIPVLFVPSYLERVWNRVGAIGPPAATPPDPED